MSVGFRVHLKSGSAIMTVDSIRKDGRVVCVWFHEDRKVIMRETFSPAALTICGSRGAG